MDPNPMEVERPDKREKRIIIEPNVTQLSRLIAILLAPAIVVVSVIGIFAKGHNTYPFSLDHVFTSSSLEKSEWFLLIAIALYLVHREHFLAQQICPRKQPVLF